MAIIPADEKVFMVDKRTNTTYGGSQALQDMQQWYTMQDVADSVQPYKVFTALLTQSGGDDPDSIGTGLLTVGKTYYIYNLPGSQGYDFTNVGAPNNIEGTSFIATGTTPNSWGPDEGVGSQILTFNNGAPVATVLENTIGNIWFTYEGRGNYTVHSDNLFTDTKTFLPNGCSGGSFTIFNQIVNYDGTGVRNSNGYSIQNSGSGIIKIQSLVDVEVFGDDVLNNSFPIEIRVYN